MNTLWLISVARVVVEVAGLALIGQGVLYLLAGANREQNFFYRILKTITFPVWKLARWVTPRFVLDQHVGYVAFLIVAVAWLYLLGSHVQACKADLRQPACSRLMESYIERCGAGDTAACEALRRNDLLPPKR